MTVMTLTEGPAAAETFLSGSASPPLQSTPHSCFDIYITCDTNSSKFINATANSTCSCVPLEQYNEELTTIAILALSVTFVMSLVGNGLILLRLVYIACVRRPRKKLGRMNVMILHLAAADLFLAFFNVLPQIGRLVTRTFKGGDVLCKLVLYLQVTAMYASSYVLLTTAVDRYLAICHPLRFRSFSNRQIHRLVAGAWIVSLSFSIPQFFIFGMHNNDCRPTFHPSWTQKLYLIWFTVAVYVIPFLILSVLYARVCAVVWRSGEHVSERQRFSAGPPQRRSAPATFAEERRRRTTRMLLAANSSVYRPNSPEVRTSRDYVTFPDAECSKLCAHSKSIAAPPSAATTTTTTTRQGGVCTVNFQLADDVISGRRVTSALDVDLQRVVSETERHEGPQSVNNRRRMTISGTKMKTAKFTVTVIVSYLVCWGIFFVSELYFALYPNVQKSWSPYLIITMLLGGLNGAINPWIYMFFNDCFPCVYVSKSLRIIRRQRTTGQSSSSAGTSTSTNIQQSIVGVSSSQTK